MVKGIGNKWFSVRITKMLHKVIFFEVVNFTNFYIYKNRCCEMETIYSDVPAIKTRAPVLAVVMSNEFNGPCFNFDELAVDPIGMFFLPLNEALYKEQFAVEAGSLEIFIKLVKDFANAEEMFGETRETFH